MRLASCFLLSLVACAAQAEDVLRVYNWKNYIDPEVLTAFEKDTGIRVDYQTFTAANELDEVMARHEPYDLVVPSHFQLERLIGNHDLLPLELNRLPHYSSVDPGLIAMLAGSNSANRYAVPYLWGVIGLAVNPALAEKAYGGPLPNSWGVLFDEAQATRLASCGLGLLDAPEETASLWFTYRGRSLSLTSARQIERNMQPLQSLGAHLRTLDNERYISDLADGRLCVAMAWVGHALTAAQTNPHLTYRIPDEGAVAFIDSLAIPAKAARPDLAYRFIDYLLQPQNALRNARVTRFYSPLAPGAELTQLAREQPMQVLKADERRRLYVLERLSAEQKAGLDAAWGKLKASYRP